MTSTAPDTDLHADAFFLADHAAVESGKLYVSGGFWNQLGFSNFPQAYTFSVAAVLHVPWRAYHRAHKFAVWFEDADGKRLGGQLDGEFQVGAAANMKVGDPTIMPFAGTVSNFPIPSAGDYAAVLSVDGTELSRWVFRARQILTPVMMGPQPGAEPGGAPLGG